MIHFDLDSKQSEIEAIEKEMMDEGFWDDHQTSQSTVQKLNQLKNIVETCRTLKDKFQFCDEKGNSYYVSKFSDKRFIIYASDPDPGQIQPRYYAWLHHLIQDVKEINTQINIYSDQSRKIDIVKQKAYYSSWNPKI